MADKLYSEQEIQELDQFARAVIEAYTADDPRQLYLKESRQPYQQYFAEVYNNLSGMRDNPRDFFESDLAMRRNWGDQIASDLARYKALEMRESATATEQPDAIKQLQAELETIKAQLAAQKPVSPVAVETADETDTESEA